MSETKNPKSRGGARPGSGRKATLGESKTISFRLPIPIIDKLESIKQARKKSRNKIVIDLIDGVEE